MRLDEEGLEKLRFGFKEDSAKNFSECTEEEAEAIAKVKPEEEEDLWGRVLELEGALLVIKEKLLEQRTGGLSSRSRNDILKYIDDALRGEKKEVEPEIVEKAAPYEDSVF